MSSPQHLLEQAYLLAKRGKKPRNADLKRAISTCYYALFHAIAFQCAETLNGSRSRSSVSWHRTYRSLDHSKAKQEFKKLLQLENDTFGLVFKLASTFIELQEERHYADYDPRPSRVTRLGVIAYVKWTEALISALPLIGSEKWHDIATILLLRDRR